MWTTIAAVVLAMALVAGPILWIMPSKYQRKVAKLRQNALHQGLRVMMNDIPARAYCVEGEQRKWMAMYYLPWLAPGPEVNGARHKVIANQAWRLIYEKLEHEVHFNGHWQWAPDQAAPLAWHQPLRDLLQELPEGVCALENNRQGIGVYWNERGDEHTVAKIALLLRQLRDQLMAGPQI